MDLVTITTAIGTAKKLMEFAKTARDAEMKMMLAELTSTLAEVKLQLADALTENAELKKAKDIRSKLEYRDLGYYAKEPIEGYGKGPFCSTCMDAHGKLICLRVWREGEEHGHPYFSGFCGNCKGQTTSPTSL